MCKYKFSYKDYYEPTPANLRKWGDLWAVFCLAIASSAAMYLHPVATVTLIMLGALGKAFSNFFTLNNDEDKQP